MSWFGQYNTERDVQINPIKHFTKREFPVLLVKPVNYFESHRSRNHLFIVVVKQTGISQSAKLTIWLGRVLGPIHHIKLYQLDKTPSCNGQDAKTGVENLLSSQTNQYHFLFSKHQGLEESDFAATITCCCKLSYWLHTDMILCPIPLDR